MRACVIVLVLGLAACATTLTDEEKAKCSSSNDTETCEAKALESKKADAQYRREDKDTLFLEQYYRALAACNANGGTMWINRHFACYGRRGNCPPQWGDTYGCR